MYVCIRNCVGIYNQVHQVELLTQLNGQMTFLFEPVSVYCMCIYNTHI